MCKSKKQTPTRGSLVGGEVKELLLNFEKVYHFIIVFGFFLNLCTIELREPERCCN
jgi:hypothetical protein